MPDLEDVYRDAVMSLPTMLDYDAADEAGTPEMARQTYVHGSLPLPPPDLETGGIIIRTGSSFYDSLLVDRLQLSAHPLTYRALGLFLVAGLLTPGANRFQLALTHPESDVRRIVFDTAHRQNHGSGLAREPRAAAYLPRVRPAHPLADPPVAAGDLPRVMLTDALEEVGRGWPGDPVRDTLLILGSDEGAYLLAELLLDISQPWAARVEYDLEGPYGFGGVAPSSAEIRFCLPGGFGWDNLDPPAPGDARLNEG